MKVQNLSFGAALGVAGAFGLALALTPAMPVSGAQAKTIYNFNKAQKPTKRVVRKRRKPQAGSPFFFSPACLIPGGGSVVCAHQTLTKKKH